MPKIIILSHKTEVIWDLAIACGNRLWQCGNIGDLFWSQWNLTSE